MWVLGRTTDVRLRAARSWATLPATALAGDNRASDNHGGGVSQRVRWRGQLDGTLAQLGLGPGLELNSMGTQTRGECAGPAAGSAPPRSPRAAASAAAAIAAGAGATSISSTGSSASTITNVCSGAKRKREFGSALA